MGEKSMMTVKELQDYLHVCERTVFKMIKNKAIPCLKICGVWRFEKTKIDEWIAHRYHKTGVLPEYEGGIKVLIVDDMPVILEVICEGIRCQINDAQIQTAANGVQALMAVGKQKPDVMILDIEMPELNGIEVCRRLKEGQATEDIFIVAVSGYSDKGYKEQVLAAGADAFMTKPLLVEELVTAIRSFWQLRAK